MLVPTLLNVNATTLSVQWYFIKQHYLLLERSKIIKEQVLLWREDCMRWDTHKSLITGVTYKRQDQEWICTIAKHSCFVSLNIKIDKTYSKLDGHQQAGVVYLWLMLDIIVNIIADVAEGLKEQIRPEGPPRDVPHEG